MRFRNAYTAFVVVPVLVVLSALLVVREAKRASSEGNEKSKKVWSGRSFVNETRVEKLPQASSTAPGFDVERVWSGEDDWEPAIAVDRASSYVYQLTTRFSGLRPCTTCPLPAIAFRRSADGGATWSPDSFIYFSNRRQADPEIEVAAGRIYAAWLDGWQLLVSRSTNHGFTWSTPVAINGNGKRPSFADKPIIAVSPNGQHVYLGFNSGDSYVAASHDFGRTFAEAVRTSRTDRTWFDTGGAVGPDGTVYFVTTDFSDSYQGDSHTSFLKSTDRGLTWTTTLVDTSREVIECASVPGCYHGFLGPSVAMAVDVAGQIMIAYHANDVADTPQQMYVRTSFDGVHFSQRRKISVPSSAVSNAFPAMAAGVTAGDFRVAWMDDRNGALHTWNTWYRRTTNGGMTWSAPKRLSNAASGAPYKAQLGFHFPYGDYFEIAVDAQGSNHLIWGEGLSYTGPGGTWYTRGQ